MKYGTIFRSDIANLASFHGQLLINGETNLELDSKKQLKLWLKSFSSDAGFVKTKVDCRKIKLEGFSGCIGIATSDNGHITVRTIDGPASNDVRFDISFFSMINVDQVLLEIVEDFKLKTLDWYFLDRNDEICVIDDQSRFDSVNIEK